MRQAIGLGFQSRRAQIFFSARDILSRFYHPGQKPPALWSRRPNFGSKTGTNSPLEPEQMARSLVVSVFFSRPAGRGASYMNIIGFVGRGQYWQSCVSQRLPESRRTTLVGSCGNCWHLCVRYLRQLIIEMGTRQAAGQHKEFFSRGQQSQAAVDHSSTTSKRNIYYSLLRGLHYSLLAGPGKTKRLVRETEIQVASSLIVSKIQRDLTSQKSNWSVWKIYR